MLHTRTLLFILLTFLIVNCSTDQQKNEIKIKGEVKEVVNTIFKGCEEANFEMTVEPFIDSPAFVYIYNGNSFTYKQFGDAIKPLFSKLINQQVTITDEKYVFLDKSIVLYITNCKFLENYKDGHSILSDPMVVQLTFKEINNKWKVINGVESSVRQDVKNTVSSNELNQFELGKQFLGNWKSEVAKDTFNIWEQKLFATGMEATIKIVTKGKIITEGKAIIGYDKKNNKFVESDLLEGSDIMVYAFWFTSKNVCIQIPYEYISNPEQATSKAIYEFKSPDLFIETYSENNEVVAVYKNIRVK